MDRWNSKRNMDAERISELKIDLKKTEWSTHTQKEIENRETEE